MDTDMDTGSNARINLLQFWINSETLGAKIMATALHLCFCGVLFTAVPINNSLETDGLTLSIYKDTAGAGPPFVTSVLTNSSVSSLSPPSPSLPFSASMSGTINLLSVNRGSDLAFHCSFGGAVLGYLHIDDHLVCTTGVNSRPGEVLSSSLDQPLIVLGRE